MNSSRRRPIESFLRAGLLAALLCGGGWLLVGPNSAAAQEKSAAAADAAPAADGAVVSAKLPSFWDLYVAGGIFMHPIALLLFVATVFGVERALGLRRSKVIPTALVVDLGQISTGKSGLDPRQAYRLCQQFPSAAASVLKSVLLKIGRPHAEVEEVVKDSSEREASRLYSNVRPINLAASVAPLIGLLGTVQGMIMAFSITANMPSNANKIQQLAEGIYTALITTFAGLVVAIPATMVSHYFEGRIQTLFREIDELLQGLLPQLERYEGKLRISPQQFSGEGRAPEAPVAEPPRRNVDVASAPH